MKSSIIRVSLVVAAVAAAVALLLVAAGRLFEPPPTTIAQEEAFEKIELLGALRADWFHAGGVFSETEARRAAERETAVHLLFLGVDRRSEERGRTDAIHLLRLEPSQLTLFSLPRDCLVNLRGDTRPEKLNHAYAYGGGALTTRTIEDLLKIKIDGAMEVDLQTFVQAARIAKVLTLDGRLIGAEEIFSRIDGLLSWLRNRSLPGGDIRRVARQQLFILKSFDWTLTLFEQHPRVFGAVTRALLKLLPTDITDRQVTVLCQLYSGMEADTTTARRDLARHASIATAERFIMPGRVVMIDIRTGEEVTPDTAAAPSAAPTEEAPARSGTTYGASLPPGAAPNGLPPTDAPVLEETPHILSFYRIEGEDGLSRRLRHWRGRGMRINYEDRDELLK